MFQVLHCYHPLAEKQETDILRDGVLSAAKHFDDAKVVRLCLHDVPLYLWLYICTYIIERGIRSDLINLQLPSSPLTLHWLVKAWAQRHILRQAF
jgi:hypothetical protein